MRATRTELSKRKKHQDPGTKLSVPQGPGSPHVPLIPAVLVERKEVLEFTASRGKHLPTKTNTSEVTPAGLQPLPQSPYSLPFHGASAPLRQQR